MACATTWMLPRSDIENMCMLSCVAIPNAALWCVIAYTNQRRSFPEKCFLAPLLFLYGCWRLCSICHINRHVFFHNSINFSSNFFTPKFYFPANSSKHVIYDAMTYKLSQLGHDVQNWSVTVVHAVNVSTTRRRVELCRYKRPLSNMSWYDTMVKAVLRCVNACLLC